MADRHRRAVPQGRGASSTRRAGATADALWQQRSSRRQPARQVAAPVNGSRLAPDHRHRGGDVAATTCTWPPSGRPRRYDLPRHAPAVRADAGVPALSHAPRRPHGVARSRPALLMLAGWGIGAAHLRSTTSTTSNRIIYIDELDAQRHVLRPCAAILVVLEGTRRVLGWALPITAIVFLAYALPVTQVTFPVLMEQVYLSTEGIFGSTLGVSASLRDAVRAVRRVHGKERHRPAVHGFLAVDHRPPAGGPGKVAVITSSSLFGTVSGSAVANVMVDRPDHHPAHEAHRLSARRSPPRSRRSPPPAAS